MINQKEALSEEEKWCGARMTTDVSQQALVAGHIDQPTERFASDQYAKTVLSDRVLIRSVS